MATWIVHLRLAENLLGLIEGLDPSYFAIGSIAPDSGIPDENWENFEPPPEILHFRAPEGAVHRLADLDFYRHHLLPRKGMDTDREHFSFLWGYYFHLVTDNLWDERVGKPTSEKFSAEFEADPKFIWQVKRDWYGLDFEYVRTHPESIYWRVFLDCAYDRDDLPFLPQRAVEQRLEYIQALYQREDDRVEEWYIQRPGRYLNNTEMESFIAGSTDDLRRIYQWLWLDEIDIYGLSSALALNLLRG
jgi:hypothetical protein